MRNLLLLILSIFVLGSCNDSTKKRKNFTIEGSISGFTKGTIFLKKKKDTLFISVDSFSVKNDGHFILTDQIESPEIYYLRIKEKPSDSILVFAEKGVLKLTASLENLSITSSIDGSINHSLLNDYRRMNNKFNDKKLDLYKLNFDASKEGNNRLVDSLNNVYKHLVHKQYLYTTNFAVKNADKAISPYLALTQLYNANIKLLDTINNSLSDDIRSSKYGKQLDDFIAFIKKNEPIK